MAVTVQTIISEIKTATRQLAAIGKTLCETLGFLDRFQSQIRTKILRTSNSFKQNSSFVARLPTIRRHKSQTTQSPADGANTKSQGSFRASRYTRTIRDLNPSEENVEVIQNGSTLKPGFSEDSVAETTLLKKISDDTNTPKLSNYHQRLSSTSLLGIPKTDNQNVQLKVTNEHLAVHNDPNQSLSTSATKVAESGGVARIPIILCGLLPGDIFSSKLSLPRSRDCEAANGEAQYDRAHYTESRRLQRVHYNDEHEEEVPRYTQLTTQHKTAIRFLRKLRYFVARRKFKEALKPYDVKDVMEQYAAGHVDLLGRVKNVHSRLDQILGKQGSKSKDAYASKFCLASRVVKIERQVEDIEQKLDILLKAYMEDRNRCQPLPVKNSTPVVIHSNGNQNGSSTDVWKLRDISTNNENPTSNGASKKILSSTPSGSNGNAKNSTLYDMVVELKPSGGAFKKSSGGSATDVENGTKKRVTMRSLSHPFEYKESSRENIETVVHEIDEHSFVDSPQQMRDSSNEVEDFEEEDLNCEGEMEQYPSWDMDSDTGADVDADCDEETTENMALLRRLPRTAIVITPITPVSSAHNLKSMDDQNDSSGNNG